MLISHPQNRKDHQISDAQFEIGLNDILMVSYLCAR